MLSVHVALLLVLARAGSAFAAGRNVGSNSANPAPPHLGPLSAVVLAGNPSPGFADGPGAVAQFARNTALDTGPQGWLYVADAGNHRVRVVDAVGEVTTLAGTGEDAQRDGPWQTAAFHDLRALSVDGRGNCYVLDGDQLRRVNASGLVSTVGTLAISVGAWPWPDPHQTNLTISGLVVSRSGEVRHLGRGTVMHAGGGVLSTCEVDILSYVFGGVGAARETLASAACFQHSAAGAAWFEFWGKGTSIDALAKGFGEEVLAYRANRDYFSSADTPPDYWYDRSTYELVTIGRLPEMSFKAPNVTPAGMVPLNAECVLIQGNGSFFLLLPGCEPVAVASDRPPQVGLAVDHRGLIYSATANQVLRFIPAATVVLALRVQDLATGEVLLSVISPPGRQVQLQQSRDFQQWEPWQTLTSTGQDAVAVKLESDRLFLRAVLLP
jgi:hypothetical protein